MKKLIAAVLALVMVFCFFAACGEKKAATANEGTTQSGTQAGTQTGTQTGTSTTDPGQTQLGTGSTGLSSVEVSTLEEVHPSDDAVLNVAGYLEPGGLTQPGHNFGADMNVASIFFEMLLAWDSTESTYAPWLATSWEWIDDLTLRLHLRDDVVSIGGDPFTANDVIFTWNLNHEVSSLAAYYSFFDYEKTKAVDDYTVDLVLLNPYPFLLTDLAHTAYDIAVQKSYEECPDTMYDPCAGTGPYKLIEWTQGQVVKAERRDDYYGNAPYYKYINWWTVTDGAARVMGVEAGDFQLATNPTVSQVIAAESNPDMAAFYIASAGRLCNWLFNSDRDPLQYKLVRQALALAIDYESILEVACSNKGVLSDHTLYSPFNPYYMKSSEGVENYYHYDPELAKQKLAEAGYADGFTINCKYRSSDDMTVKNAECLQYMLREIGVTLELMPQDSAAWYADLRNGDFDTTLSVGGNPNAKRNINFIDGNRLSHSTTTGNAGSRWQAEVPGGVEYVNDLIDRCEFTVDEELSKEYFQELSDFCAEFVPQVVLYCPYCAVLCSGDIVNCKADSMGGPLALSLYPAEYIEG
ncbi:MAG: ABC transporter substrate-binding protein [Oscillospiraceae bacterium]|nr:ABC transporter substrate-binding protein [Oscillospiraceae bacterium]